MCHGGSEAAGCDPDGARRSIEEMRLRVSRRVAQIEKGEERTSDASMATCRLLRSPSRLPSDHEHRERIAGLCRHDRPTLARDGQW